MTAGGFKAIFYSIKAAYSTGIPEMFRAFHSRNTCKSCALGMGGQLGGMKDEAGHYPEVCKKSIQAQMIDIQPPIPANLFKEKSIEEFKNTTPRLLEKTGRLNQAIDDIENTFGKGTIMPGTLLKK